MEANVCFNILLGSCLDKLVVSALVGRWDQLDFEESSGTEARSQQEAERKRARNCNRVRGKGIAGNCREQWFMH